jgi:molybdenum cofactor cytidylyltransferase
MLFAILPAAGRSTRMGRPKLSLPLGTSTVIEQVVGTLRSAGIEKILVVVGPHVRELVPLAERAGATVLELAEVTPHMRSTVERGLAWIEENWRPVEHDAFLLVPADHPALDAGVIRILCALRSEDSASRLTKSESSIVIPTYFGKRGHPTLIGWKHVAGIRALPANLGLNAYLRQHLDNTHEIAVESETVLFDLDTPEDYERLCGH